MSGNEKSCPDCATDLIPTHRNGLRVWECPSSHGVGVPLAEAHGIFQTDELAAIWHASKAAPKSQLTSPISGKPMVEVTFAADSDVRATYGADVRHLTIELDRDNYFGWFELEELDQMPRDTDGRGAKAPGLVGLDSFDAHAERHDHFFGKLTPADLEQEERGVSKLLTGLARRLR